MNDDRGCELELVDAPRNAGAVGRFLPRLRRALDGSAPLLPLPPGGAERRRLADEASEAHVHRSVALAVPTSGSTGTPRIALLSAAALQASADATHAALGGPGRWLLALPTTHIAGLQVLVRSLCADLSPAVVEMSDGFTVAAFADAVRRLDVDASEHPHYTALVPTQLRRLLDDGAGVEALWQLDAVLIGGAAVDEQLLARAADAGVTVVRTYGMTETCGGCVYDGVPLPGVEVDVDRDGVIRLRGPMLFDRYLWDAPRTSDWFTTSDFGRLDEGVLSVLGRVDNVIVSGGVKVPAELVERALRRIPGISDAVVVGVPDAEWGGRVVAVVTGATGIDVVREALRGDLPDEWLPREVVAVDALPLLASGKPDRVATRNLATTLAR
jgi:o-succinylbenzoate---CoA ligase